MTRIEGAGEKTRCEVGQETRVAAVLTADIIGVTLRCPANGRMRGYGMRWIEPSGVWEDAAAFVFRCVECKATHRFTIPSTWKPKAKEEGGA